MDSAKDQSVNMVQWLYVTASSHDEARLIAKNLVTERLAACANILGAIESIYWWDGKVQEDQEVALVLKTRRDLVPKAIARIKALHSYDCPCCVAIDIPAGSSEYLNWIVRETL